MDNTQPFQNVAKWAVSNIPAAGLTARPQHRKTIGKRMNGMNIQSEEHQTHSLIETLKQVATGLVFLYQQSLAMVSNVCLSFNPHR